MLVHIVNKVNASKIRRMTNKRGDEVIVVPSYTLPSNVVMNGILYPDDEIEKGYKTLEGKPAPIGHPMGEDGEYVSASSEHAINYYHAGVTNKNVKRVADPKHGHRIYVEKHIVVSVAERTEQGRELLKAIEDGKPIHTSTGVMITLDESTDPPTARDHIYDHDAILLDEEGAATPEQGVGLMVNKSYQDMRDKIQAIIAATFGERLWVQDFGEGWAVYDMDDVTYRIDLTKDDQGDIVTAGEPEQVTRVTTWEPVESELKRLMQEEEDEDMAYQELIDNALKEAGIDTSEMTEEQKLEAYAANHKHEPQGETVPNEDITAVVNQAVESALQAKQAESEKSERAQIAEQLKTNAVDLSEAGQAAMSVNDLRSIVQKTSPHRPAYGVAGGMVSNSEDGFDEMTMPEVEIK